ncbi:MAG: carbohydrate-binding domain-containing protein [Oscillospiraceae bacterium]|nr:carbohydrate-binding domain-containing protein [Oscillospiraceae bacterium]
MKTVSRIVALLLAICLLAGFSAVMADETQDNVQTLVLHTDLIGIGYTHGATLDGVSVPEYDYTWHADPSTDHGVVKNSPAEYYTGTAPTGEDSVYIAHDIIYYPLLDESKFKQVNYDGETEWVYMYEAEGYENYIFSTLPSLRTGFPSQMMHSETEAYNNAVLHITKAGTYKLEGEWHGQILVDLGEDAFDDPTQKVTLILNGVTITCTVAPGVIFKNVYECDNTWEDRDTYSYNVDTAEAGANVVLAEGTTNTVSGENVFRILRTKYKDEDSTSQYPAQKKQYKTDGAFYSYMSMNISGESKNTGVLNIHSGYEGLDTELHLSINGGNVNIYSQDDGINVNEDGVSVVAVNGGSLHICAGLGAEGDGIDSNGYLVIRGGTVISAANGNGADCGLDSDKGSFVLGGTVVALGGTMDWAESDEAVADAQAVLNLRFSGTQSADEAIIITDTAGKVIFAYDPDKDEVLGGNGKTYSGAILSCEGLEVSQSYHIYVGGNVTGSEASGLYHASSVTGFDGATQQCYSGNSVGGMGGGNRFPDGGQMGQMPDGNFPGNMQSGDFQPPQGSFDPGQFGGQMGGQFGDMMDSVQTGATCTYERNFTLSKTVNAFSNLSDVRHDSATVNGDSCALCSGTNVNTGTAPETPAAQQDWLGYGIAFVLGILAASAIFTVVLLIKKKK